MPSQNKGGTTTPQIEHIEPVPSSYTMLGLNSALARAVHLKDDDQPSLAQVQRVTNVLTFGLYLASVLVAWRLLRGHHALSEQTRLSLSYGLFFALMPLMTFHAHPHTFVFLLPAWTAIAATLRRDGDRSRTVIFGALFLTIYVCAGLPAAVVPIDRWLGTRFSLSTPFTDPIWPNLALTVAIAAYALMRTLDAAEPVRSPLPARSAGAFI